VSKSEQGAAETPDKGDSKSSNTSGNTSGNADAKGPTRTGGGASRTARSATGTTGTGATSSKSTSSSSTGSKSSTGTGDSARTKETKETKDTKETTTAAKTGSGSRSGSASGTAKGTGTFKPLTSTTTSSKTATTVDDPPPPSPPRDWSRFSPRTWLRRVPRWWPLPVCLALGSCGGAAYAVVTPPQYAAISYVVVSPAGRAEAAAALGYAQAYGKIATDPVILAKAEADANVRRGTLNRGIQASTSPDAPMVQITATSLKPASAARYADAVGKALTQTAKSSAKKTGARLTVVSKSVAPAAPTSPSSGVSVAVGACAGGLIGGLVLLTRPQWGRRESAASGPVPTGPTQTENIAGSENTEAQTDTSTTAASTTAITKANGDRRPESVR
jgi:capsular polysaccharide biosynthesis protein